MTNQSKLLFLFQRPGVTILCAILTVASCAFPNGEVRQCHANETGSEYNGGDSNMPVAHSDPDREFVHDSVAGDPAKLREARLLVLGEPEESHAKGAELDSVDLHVWRGRTRVYFTGRDGVLLEAYCPGILEGRHNIKTVERIENNLLIDVRKSEIEGWSVMIDMIEPRFVYILPYLLSDSHNANVETKEPK